MPAARAPAREDAAAARQMVLSGLARDASVADLISQLALHPRHNTFPGEVFLRLAADALAWSGVSPADPLPLEGMRERFLPGYSGRGRDRGKLQYALLAAAALHGGAEPDLLDEVAWWQADDFWQHALLAAVLYVRAGADRAGVSVRQACRELAKQPGERPSDSASLTAYGHTEQPRR